MSGRKVDFFKHNLDDECLAELNAAARNPFITLGPKTKDFERRFAAYLGMSRAVGVMSCTHALHLSYVALGIGSGDEVIVPAFTFAATLAAVFHAGAKPVLADVHPDTGLIDPEKAARAITPRTKAICPVHLYGVPAPMPLLADIAGKAGIAVVEDAAHCIEGRGPDFRLGQFSDAVAFSFYATKNITSGEGGAVATNNPALAEKIGVLRNHGMDKNATERSSLKVPMYDIEQLGYKSNLTDLQAALLIPQLARIEERWERRADIVARYNEALSSTPGIRVPVVPDGFRSAHHLYTIRVGRPEKRDEFLAALLESGVGCSVNYRPLSDLTFYREKLGIRPEDFPNATAIGRTTITLPLYPLLDDSEVDYVIETVKKLADRLL